MRTSLSVHPISAHVCALYQHTAAIPGATVLGPKDPAAARGLGGPVPYHLAEKRTRPSAFLLDTFLVVVSDLKGPFLPSVKEQLLGVLCGFHSKAVREPLAVRTSEAPGSL